MFVSLSTCDLSCSNQETRLSNLEAALQSHVLEAQGVAQTVTKSVSIQDDLLKAKTSALMDSIAEMMAGMHARAQELIDTFNKGVAALKSKGEWARLINQHAQ